MSGRTILPSMRRGPFERIPQPFKYDPKSNDYIVTPVDATPRAQEPAGGGAGPAPASQATPRPHRPSFDKPGRYDFGMSGHKSKNERAYDDGEDE